MLKVLAAHSSATFSRPSTRVVASSFVMMPALASPSAYAGDCMSDMKRNWKREEKRLEKSIVVYIAGRMDVLQPG